MIIANVDQKVLLKDIQKQLGELENQAPSVLKKSLNATVKNVRKRIIAQAKKEYQISDSNELNTTDGKIMRLRSATTSRSSTQLRSKGPMQELMDFLVSPTDLSRGLNRPSYYSAKVLSESSLAALQERPKPFVTQFKSGHIAIVSRLSDGERKARGKSSRYIRKLLSPAVPHMLQNPEVQEQARGLVGELLPSMIQKEIDKTLKRAVKAAAKGGSK